MRILLMLVLPLSFACRAQIETRPFNPTTFTTVDTPINGVIYYPPQYMKLTYAFSTRVDKDGNVVGSSDATDAGKKCELVVQKEEVQVMPDYLHPLALINKPAWFGTSKFSATFANGMLVSVNSESAPQGVELLKAITEVAKVAGLGPAFQPGGGDAQACNAGPRLVAFAKIDPR
jgi:hypothetical protein